MDTLSKQQRSTLMSRVRSRGNATTEAAVARVFRSMHVVGWRRHSCLRLSTDAKERLRTYPDFVFRQSRLAVFVDGCFWHGCRRHRRTPKTNTKWWCNKVNANRARDQRVTKLLRAHGWRVIRIWEHDVRSRPQHCVSRVQHVLKKYR
jgi:DNA mismatch endonuclease (patch repair protein)